jgi:hypothetical protein
MANKKLVEAILKRTVTASQDELYASIGKKVLKLKKSQKKVHQKKVQ